MNHPYLLPLLEQFDQSTDKVIKVFSNLNTDQLNWKPAPEVWSAGQCLDHLIVSNQQYFGIFNSLASQSYKPGTWARISPFSNYFGNFLLQITEPVVKKKGQAPKVFRPTKSSISGDIVQRFVEHQKDLRELIQRVDMWGDHGVVIPSPAAGFVTYKLDTCIRILVQHEMRHINQAERIVNHKDFPA